MESAYTVTVRKILVVEDEVIVAEDIRRRLTEMGFVVSGVVSTGEDAIREASRTLPDLVLMDIFLRGKMDGIEAAEILGHRFHVPVVFLSASADPATLERAKHADSFGYLLKPFDEREMESTIEMALSKHAMERRLQESEVRFRLLYEDAPLPYQSLGEDTRLLDVNKSWLDSLGYSREEVIGHPFGEFVTTASASVAEKVFPVLNERGDIHGVELEMVRKNGTHLIASFDARTGSNGGLHTRQTHCIFKDVTDQRQLERQVRERNLFLRSLMESSSSISIISTNIDGLIEYWNVGAENIFGYAAEEMVGKAKIESLYVPGPETAEAVKSIRETVLERRESVRRTLKEVTKDGRFLWISVTASPRIDEHGSVTGLFGIGEDITERTIAEDALRRQTALYETILKTQSDMGEGLAILEADRFAYVNDAFCRLSGYQANECLELTSFMALLAPEERPAVVARRNLQLERTDSGDHIESVLVTRSGDRRDVEIAFRAIDPAAPSRLMAIFHDITARRQSEHQVTLLARTLASTKDCVSITDDQNTILFVNKAFCTTYGYAEHELLGQNIAMVLSPLAPPNVTGDVLRGTVDQGWDGEIWNRRKDGTDFLIELSTSVVRDDKGKSVALVGVARDITERNHAKKLQDSVYRISEAAQSGKGLPDMLGTVHGIIADLMPARNLYVALYDSVEDQLSFPYFVDEFEPPPPPQKPGKGLTEYVLRTGKPLLASPCEFEALATSGAVESVGPPSVDWLGVPLKIGERTLGVLVIQSYSEGVRFKEADKQILGFVSAQIAMAVDKKQAEQVLQTSEAELRALFSAMNDVILLMGADGRYLKIAPTNPELLYRPSEAMLGKTLHEIFPTDIADWCLGKIREALSTNKDVAIEYALPINGREVWFEGNISPATEQTVIWVARDVTAKKQAAESLRQADETYRAVFEDAVMGIFKSNPDGTYVSVNPALARIFGYDQPDEFLSAMKEAPCKPYIDPGRGAEFLDAVRADNALSHFDSEVQRKDGSIVWITESARPVRDEQGTIQYLIGTVEDITARKQAEKELKLLAYTITCAMDCFVITDLEGIILFVNEAFARTYGYADTELIGANIKAIHTSGSPPVLTKEHLAELPSGNWNGEIMNRRNDGTTFPVELWTSVVRDDVGAPVAQVGVARDITERRRIEEAVRQSETGLRRITDNMLDMISQVDLNGVFAYVSPSVKKVLGYEPQELLGLSALPLTSRRDVPGLIATFQAASSSSTIATAEHRFKHKDGHYLWVESMVNPLREEDGTVTGFVIGSRDVTKKKYAEEALKRDELRLEALVALSQMTGASRQRLSEFTLAEALRLTRSQEGYLAIVNPDNSGLQILTCASVPGGGESSSGDQTVPLNFMGPWKESLRRKRPVITNAYHLPRRWPEGTPSEFAPMVRHMSVPVFEGEQIVAVAGVANKSVEYDESDLRQLKLLMEGMSLLLQRQKAEEQVRTSLEEKEILLKEIHHRVKNNLQIVSSLLNLQAGYVKDEGDLEIFKESQHRIKSMALIHERLYRSRDLSKVDFAQYIQSLTTYLFHSYSGNSRSVKLQVDVQDVVLGVDEAIPCGLIINELVSNSLKHAFPDGRGGRVSVCLRKNEQGYLLRVSDNGVGFPRSMNFRETDTLGLQLVHTLSEQIGASVEMENTEGTTFTIRF